MAQVIEFIGMPKKTAASKASVASMAKSAVAYLMDEGAKREQEAKERESTQLVRWRMVTDIENSIALVGPWKTKALVEDVLRETLLKHGIAITRE